MDKSALDCKYFCLYSAVAGFMKISGIQGEFLVGWRSYNGKWQMPVGWSGEEQHSSFKDGFFFSFRENYAAWLTYPIQEEWDTS